MSIGPSFTPPSFSAAPANQKATGGATFVFNVDAKTMTPPTADTFTGTSTAAGSTSSTNGSPLSTLNALYQAAEEARNNYLKSASALNGQAAPSTQNAGNVTPPMGNQSFFNQPGSASPGLMAATGLSPALQQQQALKDAQQAAAQAQQQQLAQQQAAAQAQQQQQQLAQQQAAAQAQQQQQQLAQQQAAAQVPQQQPSPIPNAAPLAAIPLEVLDSQLGNPGIDPQQKLQVMQEYSRRGEATPASIPLLVQQMTAPVGSTGLQPADETLLRQAAVFALGSINTNAVQKSGGTVPIYQLPGIKEAHKLLSSPNEDINVKAALLQTLGTFNKQDPTVTTLLKASVKNEPKLASMVNALQNGEDPNKAMPSPQAVPAT